MGNTLSFTTTKSEVLRVVAGSAYGQKVDPRGTADIVMIVVISIVYFVDVLAALYLLWNRRYPPLKSKSPVIMTMCIVASVLWFAGDIQVNGHAPLEGTPMAECKAFGVWMRVLLGVCTLSALVALRSYGLYRVFCRNLPYSGIGLYLPFVIYCVCILVYGIVSQVLSARTTIHYMPVLDICYYEPGYKASLFALLWVTWIFVALINWRIRHIKSSFNESREMLAACIAVFAVLIFTTVMHYARPNYPLSVRLRITTTVLDHLATNTVWWLIMAAPLFNCIRRRREYLRMWLATLRSDGLQREYEVASHSGPQPTDVEAFYYFNGVENKEGFFYSEPLDGHSGSLAERPESPVDSAHLPAAGERRRPSTKRAQGASLHAQRSFGEHTSAPLRLDDMQELQLEPINSDQRLLI
ncbi:hypothetical protein GGI25_005770 [Coemansia spiralis]|uniref:Uncharacterized protein n=2 Tax=Coemansia TaxID=4863 RepID=A0A9W8G2A4_9FUNG|nr:hypothetical protein BX070DRAFT_252434 [Coemansia spiralis]KAJ1988558.1 hypothetical protein EDC05_005221 [Coemansia umbellata]KAJ2619912.1 hypothetical protein GGI26_005447 [Coemansia sp. RSA 1358]KAJ2670635.1 hypothetical protein GGI25_005770 [Coemansia spiralis]